MIMKIIYISKIQLFISYSKIHQEYKQNEYYFKLCNNNKLRINKFYKKLNEPKISIISPMFNREKYILRFIKSIQYQNFNSIEIIVIDDFSNDNSVKIIENLQKLDKRIILLKNIKNKGTFITRNIGIIYAKAKYLIAPDPDDILSKNILSICYKYVERFNYDIIRFNMYIGKEKLNLHQIVNKLTKKMVNQPELSTYTFYGTNELQLIDLSLCNKLIKKKIYMLTLNLLNNYYYNMYITYSEDTLINYILYRKAKSYIFLNNIGYYYIKNSLSITNNLFRKSNLKINFFFILLKFFFEYSRNTKYEKDISNFLFSKLNVDFNLLISLSNINNNRNKFIECFYGIINMYLNSKYISKENKNLFFFIIFF